MLVMQHRSNHAHSGIGHSIFGALLASVGNVAALTGLILYVGQIEGETTGVLVRQLRQRFAGN